ncbi:Uncharacterized protein FWK35_00018847, partial [Aphis craccivora]
MNFNLLIMADNKCKKLKNCSKRHIRRITNEFCRRFDNEHYSDTTSENDIVIRAPEIQSTIVYVSTSSNVEPKMNNDENNGHNLPIFSLSNNTSAQHDENEYYSSSSNNSSYYSSPISSSCDSYDNNNINLVEINNVDSLIENNKDENTADDCSNNLDMNCSLVEEQLREWHFNYNTTLASFSSMLKIWKKFKKFELPSDARTLLSTPRSVRIKSIEGGKYCHFGLKKAVHSIILALKLEIGSIKEINLTLNIDGLPISRSNQSCFWPIMISELRLKQKVFIVGVFHGYGKPKCPNEYLEEFISELVPLINNGFLTEEGEVIPVVLSALICDAPAKSFVLCTSGHTAYGSCSKCTIIGKYINNRLCFPSDEEYSEFNLRSDEDFSKFLYKNKYQHGISIFTTSVPSFGSVSCVPLDYCHVVCLGVMKKLIYLWVKGPRFLKLKPSDITVISEKLIEMQQYTPKDFARKPRALSEFLNWKATEFRQFLLYTGPVVLKSVLKSEYYDHFIILHVSISILVNSELIKNEHFITYSHKLLQMFVFKFQNLYGEYLVSHNVHNLLHLSDDVKKYGALDVFSAFKFENNMMFVKKLLQK